MSAHLPSRRSWNVVETIALTLATLVLAPTAVQCQTTNWTGAAGVGGSGNYNVLGNWDNGIPNGAGFNAVVSTLNGGNPYTITLNSDASVNSLAISSPQATFDHVPATYIATTVNISAGVYRLSGGTLSGATVNVSGTGVLRATSTTSLLRGVTVGLGALDLTGNTSRLILRANGGTPTTFAAGTALTLGTSALLAIDQTSVLDNVAFTLGASSAISAEGSNTVTFGPATTITLATATTATLLQPQLVGGTSSFVNQGLIQSTATNATLGITPSGTFTNGTASPNSGIVRSSGGGIVTIQPTGAFTNQAGGLVDVLSGSTINVRGAGWSNAGTFQVTSGTLNLGGTFTTAGVGTITRSGTSVVALTGQLNNAGASNLLTLTGPLQLVGGTITDGNLVANGASVLQATGSTGVLSGVAVGLGAVDMTASSGRLILRANGGMPTTFAAGTALTLGTSALLAIDQTSVLDNVAFTLGASSAISAEGSNTVTFGPATTITLATATTATLLQPQLVGGTSSFVNQGLIQSTATNATLGITPSGTFTNGTASPNSGIVRSSGGGIVTIQPTGAFTNQAGGLVDVLSGSTINVRGAGWSNAGTFQVTSGTLNLGGTFTTAGVGTITRSGTSVVALTGQLNNAGASNLLTLTGPLQLVGGTITDGNLVANGASVLQATGSTGVLSGVAVGLGAVDMTASSGRLILRANGGTPTTFAAGTALTLGTSALLAIDQTSVLDNVAFTLGASSAISAEGSNTVTFGPATTITLATATTATLLQPQLVGGTSSYVNQGLIQSTAANATLNITPNGTFTNSNGGIVRSSGGGIVTIQPTGAFTNQAGGLVDVLSGSTINVRGAGWSNAGTFQVTSGTLNLGGTFTTAGVGTITRSGTSVVALTGQLNNAGASNLLTLTGPLQLVGGTITDGNLVANGASVLQATGSTGVLSGVAVGLGAVDMTASSGRLILRANGGTPTTFAAGTALTFGTSALLAINQTSVLDNVAFALVNASSISAEGNNTVTFGPATTITLATANASASLVQPQLVGGTSSFVNQGLIQSTASNATLTINPNGMLTNSGTLTAISGGILNIPAATNLTNFNAGTLTGGTYQVFPSSVINFNGRVVTTVGPGTTVLMDGASSVFTAMNTVTTNNGSFTIGNGKQFMVSGGTLTNTGTLTIGTAQGDLSTITGNIVANAGSVIRGRGTIAGAINMASGTTLAPGTSPGILTVTGPVTMVANSTFSAELNGATAGTGYSQLNLAGGGSINLTNATLATTLGYFPDPSDILTIISGGPVTGEFANAPNGTAFVIGTFMGTLYRATVIYTANSVVLTNPVPEPATILGVCAAAAGAVGWWRRRKNPERNVRRISER